MKTPDYISKKRQRIKQELEFWNFKAQSANTKETVLFCRQEAAKRIEDLDKLSGKTLRQRRYGWR